jgi:hypothetical protein
VRPWTATNCRADRGRPAGPCPAADQLLARLERVIEATLGSLEFVGPFEVRGWKLAGTLVPFAYIGWSVWLLALGIGLLITA